MTALKKQNAETWKEQIGSTNEERIENLKQYGWELV